MPTLIAGVVAIILLYALPQMFRAANPVVLARAIKIGGGVVALAVAAFTGVKGELAVAIPLGIFGAGLLGWSPFGTSGFGNIGGLFGGASSQRSPGQTSRVRSQFLDTFVLVGFVVKVSHWESFLGILPKVQPLATASGSDCIPFPVSEPPYRTPLHK